MTNQPRLRTKLTCPSCWFAFPPEETQWVAEHPDLRGDIRLGDDAAKRFLPSRFDADGFALDSMGHQCQQLACPRCHLPIPRILFEITPLFLSIIGAPSAGKSYFLASCIWQTRQRLESLGVTFADADPVANRVVSDYEQKLFLSDRPDALVAIPKTEEEGELYQSVSFGTHTETFPRPFVYRVTRKVTSPSENGASASGNGLSRALCLYDNAGEHFQPRNQSSASVATNHLALSKCLLFLFDPLQHPKFRLKCQAFSADPQIEVGRTMKNHRQDEILLEAAKRIRQRVNLASDETIKVPLVVVVNKYDVWGKLLPQLDLNSYRLFGRGPQNCSGVNMNAIAEVSAKIKGLLKELTPEFVATCNNFSEDVTYIPASPLGCSPEIDPTREGVATLGVRPGRIDPIWAEVPLLFALVKSNTGLLQAMKIAKKTSEV